MIELEHYIPKVYNNYEKKVIIILTSILFIFIIYWVSTSLATEGNMTENCLEEPGPEKGGGWTWFGITMGVSTRSDMFETFGEPEKEPMVYHKGRDQTECSYSYSLEESNLFISIINGRIAAIEFLSPDYPLGKKDPKFSDLINIFGPPDLVGYNTTYGGGARTVVWLDKGVQAVINLNRFPYDPEQTMVMTIMYIYPMDEESFIKSLLSGWYSEKRPESDVLDLAPMDPFKWED